MSASDSLPEPEVAARIDSLAERALRRGQVGLVVATLDCGERTVRGFGRARDEGDEAPDADTLFELGSVTKVLTGLLRAREHHSLGRPGRAQGRRGPEPEAETTLVARPARGAEDAPKPQAEPAECQVLDVGRRALGFGLGLRLGLLLGRIVRFGEGSPGRHGLTIPRHAHLAKAQR